jgi:hypothetical protein
MESQPRSSRHQFSLQALLILALVAPPLIAGCAYVLRFAPVAHFAVWLALMIYEVRRILSPTVPRRN